MNFRRIMVIFGLTVFAGFQAVGQYVTTLHEPGSIFFDDELVMDASGTIYGSNYAGNSVNKREPNGTVSTFATGFSSPNGLAVDGSGNLWVADPDANRIYKLNSVGTFLDTVAMSKPAGLLRMHGSDTLLVSSWLNNKLLKMAPDGSYSNFITGSPLDGPFSMAYNATADEYYVANFNNREIYRINGTQLEYIATVPAPNTPGNKWLASIECANNTILATSMNVYRIYMIYPHYTDSVQLLAGTGQAGHTDGHVDSATFNLPNGLLVSPGGDSVFVSEYGGGYLRLITGQPLSVPEPESSVEMKLYPNPAQDELIISVGHLPGEECELHICDLAGRPLVRKTIRSTEDIIRIDVGHLPSGGYSCVLQFGDSRVSRTFVKNRNL